MKSQTKIWNVFVQLLSCVQYLETPMDCSIPGFPVLRFSRVCSNSCLLNWWCHPTISSSGVPFSSFLQSFPASGSFQMSWLLTGLISLQSTGPSGVFSSITIWKHQFFDVHGSTLTSIHDYWENHSSDYREHFGKVMSLLFNVLYRFVIAFLPGSKCLRISWMQSPSTVILEPKKIKSVTVSIVSPSVFREVMGLDVMILVFRMLSFKPTFSTFFFL